MKRILAALAFLLTTSTSLVANDTDRALNLFEGICLAARNNVDRIASEAQRNGLREANLSNNPIYEYMVSPGERYFVETHKGKEQFIVSGLEASIDDSGLSVLCGVKAFGIEIEQVLFIMSELGFEFKEFPGPAYLNDDSYYGKPTKTIVQNFVAGNRRGVSVLIIQPK